MLRCTVAVTAALLSAAPALAQVAAPVRSVVHTDSTTVARARALIRARTEGRVPGAQVAVMLDGRTIWSEGFGLADLEQRVAVTPLTRFRIGSISKSLTSAALGLMVEEGRLDLDAPIQRYVPSFPPKPWPITTRELAGHLAGVRHYRGNEFLLNRHFDDVVAGLAVFENDSLLFEPGTRYSYSSYGWNLVSAAVEAAAGQPFLQLMQSRVFGPLGMTRTTPDLLDTLLSNRGRYYDRDSTGMPYTNSPAVDNSYKWAGGGFLSTAEDLCRFGSALLRPGFLRPETVRALWSTQHTRDGRATGYGMGWFVGPDSTGRFTAEHGGGSIGGTAILIIYPDAKLVVTILTNLTGAGGLRTLASDVAHVFFHDPPTAR